MIDRKSTAYRFVQVWLYGLMTVLCVLVLVKLFRHIRTPAGLWMGCLMTTLTFVAFVAVVRHMETTSEFHVPKRRHLVGALTGLGVAGLLMMGYDFLRHKPDWFGHGLDYLFAWLIVLPFFMFRSKKDKSGESTP